MTATILITGFGPFPGAPFNPTEPLVMELARRRHNVRRVGHVFRVSYEAVDRELTALLAREKPDALIMFGLAARTRHLRVETRARNAHHASAARCRWTDTCHRRHRGGGAGDAAAAGPGATAAHGGAGRPACRLRSPTTPAAISATICAGGPPRPPTAADRGSPHSSTCRACAAARCVTPSRRPPLTLDDLTGPAKRSCARRSSRRVDRAALTLSAVGRAVPVRHTPSGLSLVPGCGSEALPWTLIAAISSP